MNTKILTPGGITTFFLAATLSLTATAHGRIGETLEECMERYGQALEQPSAVNPASPPLSGPEPDAVFSVGDFRVHCWYNSVGVCDRIAYWHVARAAEATDRPPTSQLTRRELVHMLEINLAHDQSWTPLDDFGLTGTGADVEEPREDYSWWRRTFAPETIPDDPAVEEYSWWRRTFAPQTLPGYVPPPAAQPGIRIPAPPTDPPVADSGPADGVPNHNLAWITTEGSRFALYHAATGLFEIMTRDAARRQNLREETDENLQKL